MREKRSGYWLLLLIPVAVGLAWLYFTSGPKMTVKKNTTRQTMQQRLEADNVVVSYGNKPRFDESFGGIFKWTIILDGVSFDQYKYSKDHPSDRVWITGNKPQEERCYIFMNRTPPSALNELTQYLYR